MNFRNRDLNILFEYKGFLDTEKYKVCGINTDEKELEITYYKKEDNSFKTIYVPSTFFDTYNNRSHFKYLVSKEDFNLKELVGLISPESEVTKLKLAKEELERLYKSFTSNRLPITLAENKFKELDARKLFMENLLNSYAASFHNYSHERFFFEAMNFLSDTNLYSSYNGASYGTICVNDCYALITHTDYPLDIYNKIKSIFIDGFSILCNAKYKQDLMSLKFVLKNLDIDLEEFSSLSEVEKLCLVTIEEIEVRFNKLVSDLDYYTKRNTILNIED